MNSTEKNTVDKLKSLIDKNGPDYLYNEPYLAYKELTVTDSTDAKMAGAILLALVSGICRDARRCGDQEALSKLIQKECCLNKEMADRLAVIFHTLYSKDNDAFWEARKLNGWRQFVKSKFCCIWEGFSVWNADGGSVDCHYQAEIILKPVKMIRTDEDLSRALNDNPFITQEAITEYYTKKISSYLDDEFEEYCICDDYYQPVVEDFEIESCIASWCKKNGFELVSCEGSGYDDGYEPSFR